MSLTENSVWRSWVIVEVRYSIVKCSFTLNVYLYVLPTF